MSIYLVRHSHAESRQGWDGHDGERPLSAKGRARAASIAARLADRGIDEIWSSPLTRCVETVEPLGGRCGVAVQRTDALIEGAPLAATVELVERLVEDEVVAVLCSHGDVITDLLAALARRGAELDPHGACPKGSIWILHVDGGTVTRADYAGKG